MSDFTGRVPHDFSSSNFDIRSKLTGCGESLLRVRTVETCELSVNGLPVSSSSSSIALIPDGDNLRVTPSTTNNEIFVDGQSGVVSFGLTTPSNTLTIRDLRNLSPFVCGNDPTSSEYQTVTSALAAADASGTTGNIILQQAQFNGETITATIPQLITGVGSVTSVISNSTINIPINNLFFFENVIFVSTTFNITNGSIANFTRCRLLGCTVTATNSSVEFFDTAVQGGTVAVTGGNANQFNHSTFGAPVTLTGSSTINGPTDCIFSEITITNPLSAFVCSNCTFRNNFATFNGLPAATPTLFNNCTFDNIAVSFGGGAGVTSIVNSSFQFGSFAVGVGAFVRCAYCAFFQSTLTPFVQGVGVQFIYCEIAAAQTIVFEGIPTDFQTLRFCTVSNFLANAALPMIQINGANAFLRTNHCSFDGDSSLGFGSSVIFDFTAGAHILLYSASLICGAANYATGVGTIIRPVTQDSLGNPQGTNIIQGLATSAVTMTDTVPTWTYVAGFATFATT